MKELMTGLLVGALIGAVITENNAKAKRVVSKGSKAVMQKLNDTLDKM